MAKYCQNCGKEVRGIYEFCPECGKSLNMAKPTPNKSRSNRIYSKPILVFLVIIILLFVSIIAVVAYQNSINNITNTTIISSESNAPVQISSLDDLNEEEEVAIEKIVFPHSELNSDEDLSNDLSDDNSSV